MEMPVPCSKCDEWIELNSTRKSPLNEQLMCSECYEKDDEVNDLVEEIKDIEYMLENDDPEVKGDRRGWKRNIKELKEKITSLGYDYNDFAL